MVKMFVVCRVQNKKLLFSEMTSLVEHVWRRRQKYQAQTIQANEYQH